MLFSKRFLASSALATVSVLLFWATTAPAATTTNGATTSVSGTYTGSSSSQSSGATSTSGTTQSTTSTAVPGTTTSSSSQSTTGTQPSTGTTVSQQPAATTTVPSSSTSTTAVSSVTTLKAYDTIYLKLTPPASTTTTTTGSTVSTTPSVPLPKTRVFSLDKQGVLNLPYIGRLPLAGLTEEEAILRVKAEPLLESYTVELRILPVEKTGVDSLKPFGYSLFDSPPTTFAPTEDIPVPADYVIGVNDTIIIQFYGGLNETHTLVVTREGMIDIPQIGPVPVAGLSFKELKEMLSQRVSSQMIGVNSHISLGPLRSILVFVMGDVVRPGSYTVSSLSTLTNALFASGGVTTIGSLRDIQLKRRGKVVSKLDFYDLLLKGDTSRDVRLQGGDVIFVPPIGKIASVAGEVRRPGIYELSKEKSVKELIDLAGGMTPDAYSKGAQLQRISGNQDRVQEDIDLSLAGAQLKPIQNGDVLVIPALLDKVEEIVRLSGYVKRPGAKSWREGMRLTDMIPSTRVLLPKPDLDYAVIKRHTPGERHISVVSVRLGEALSNPNSPANMPLQRGDEIIVFGHEVIGDRQNKLADIIAELERQSSSTSPAKVVNVSGSIYEPGVYPLEDGMRVADLVRASGQVTENAELLDAELTRIDIVSGVRKINHQTVNLAKAMQGDPAANIVLQPRDYLVVKKMPESDLLQTVTLSGEVKNPGVYPIARGETLRNVLQRAGGLTPIAFADGAVFTRVELQQKEEAQFKELADRIESEMKTTLIERSDQVTRPQENADIAKSVVDILRNMKSTGRMVIDLNAIMQGKNGEKPGEYDITLMGGDSLTIPQKKDEVSVVGEVRKPATHLFAKGLSVEDYIKMSGGLTDKSKNSLVYVIRANGAAVGGSKSFFSFLGSGLPDADIRPGDSIVAMLDAEKVSWLKIWRDVMGNTGALQFSVDVYDRVKGKAPTNSQISITPR